MEIKHASLDDLDHLLPLFEAYRAYYHQSPKVLAKEFLRTRLQAQEAIIFLALTPRAQGAGFALVYSSYNSVILRKTYILHDLYVDAAYRGQGLGRRLLTTVINHAKRHEIAEITLMTEKTNTKAQKLYHAAGFEEDSDYLTYLLRV